MGHPPRNPEFRCPADEAGPWTPEGRVSSRFCHRAHTRPQFDREAAPAAGGGLAACPHPRRHPAPTRVHAPPARCLTAFGVADTSRVADASRVADTSRAVGTLRAADASREVGTLRAAGRFGTARSPRAARVPGVSGTSHVARPPRTARRFRPPNPSRGVIRPRSRRVTRVTPRPLYGVARRLPREPACPRTGSPAAGFPCPAASDHRSTVRFRPSPRLGFSFRRY